MIPYKIYLAVFSILITSVNFLSAEIFTSKEHGFVVNLPGKAESLKMNNALGKMVSHGVFDEKKTLVYQVIIQDMRHRKEFQNLTEVQTKTALKTNFDAYVKETDTKDVKSSWSKLVTWSTIEFACRHEGFFSEGQTTYKRGYSFLHNGLWFKLTVHGLKDDKELESSARDFMASFSFVDQETATKIEETK